MTEPTTVPDPSATVTPSTPSAIPPTSASPTPEPWRAGPNAPPWAQGKSAEEILQISQQMYGILENFNQQGRIPQQQAAIPMQPATQPMVEPADDDYLTGRQVKSYIQNLTQTALNPQLQALATLASQGALVAVQNRYQDEFKRWGPEINGYVSALPPQERTIDNLERIVHLTRGRHQPELLAEHEAQLRQRLQSELVSPGMRATGTPGAGSVPSTDDYSLQSDKLPPQWRERAMREGLTDHQIDEFCRANNTTRKDFFELVMGGQVLTDKGAIRA